MEEGDIKYIRLETLKKYPCGVNSNGDIFGTESSSNKGGIYFLFDINKKLVYVGQSFSIKSRLWQHLSPNNNHRYNLEEEDNSYSNQNYTSKIPFGMVKYYSFIECKDKLEKNMLEKIYIFKYRPYINISKPRDVHNFFRIYLDNLDLIWKRIVKNESCNIC